MMMGITAEGSTAASALEQAPVWPNAVFLCAFEETAGK